MDGEPTELTYIKGAYDAGSLTNEGILTVMWGRPDCGEHIMYDDYATLRGVEEEATIVCRMIVDQLQC